jgi:periplasmic divalent cation tolerance protein
MLPVAAQDLIVVVTSVGTEDQALDVAHALIRNRQAACVNILPNVHSIYRWKGRVCDDTEMLLFIKTVAGQFESVLETIQKVNTYELPEVLAYRVDRASDGYGDWIARMTERPKKRAAAARPRARRPTAVTTVAG